MNNFSPKYHGQSPYYEIWYGKIDLSPDQAFWFRYTLIDGKVEESATWAILFDHGKIHAGKNTESLSSLQLNDSETIFSLGKSSLRSNHAIGAAGDLSWDFAFVDHGKSFEHVPPWMKFLGLSKSVLSSCCLDLRCSGTIKYQNQALSFKHANGMLGHIYGKKQADSWAWAHCNSFEDHEDVVFEGISVRIKLAGKTTPPLSSFILHVGDSVYGFSSLRIMLSAESTFEQGRWNFKTEANGMVLSGELKAPEQVALVQYTDTDASSLWCFNSKLSSLRLSLQNKADGWEKTFHSERQAGFETVTRVPPTQTITL